ncbi:protein-disulfide reductase DsbD family protein [Aquabacter spiritensis]|uniref:Thiol:disulfide interchange protein DsbD n=1 Tax=Aquabacter spiritensis TaxID=933073 RepID=A0A4R3M8L7_9HYPH|nr:protein-disulfide reductase DsbD domain-containing protein [Aquabacter spiritensis]TCT07695.1 thiol:disulfide interchange protein DsbD [Aquabacter spiritensis]
MTSGLDFLRGLVCTALLAVFALASPRPAGAVESAPQVSPRATVTLIADQDAVTPGGTVRIALRQKLAPHWHTYWKNPGDAGAAPEIALTLPDGAAAGEIAWPGPDRFSVGPVTSFGYEREIVLPMTVSVPASAVPGGTFGVAAEAQWLVCEKECIPEEGRFRLDLPIAADAAPAAGDVAAAFAASAARQPVNSPFDARLSVEGSALALTVEGAGLGPDAVKDAFFYPGEWGQVVHAAPQSATLDPGKLTLAMAAGPTFAPDAPLAGLLALTDPGGATRWFEIAPQARMGAAAPNDGAADRSAPSLGGLSLWQAAAFAFLGGLILNLMPCVFPILAMKATALSRLSGGRLRDVRVAGLVYTLGVIAAFLALAGTLLALRAGGAAVGWGFQFQSPIFVAAMSWLLLAIGLNLSGVYEIGFGTAGLGQGLAQRPGHAGSFFTGILAVVVATPCTAPFMGAAIGAALAAPAVVCLALFAAMGLGLAAPYALLALAPRLARRLPRPGLWMVRLRQAMAFPMYASAAWLVWVLVQQAGDFGVLIGLGGALLIAFSAWIFGLSQQSRGHGLLARGLALATLACTFALLPQLRAVAAPDAAVAAAGAEPFDAERLAALRRDGRPVLVNMTAAWCITCLVNERTALSTKGVKAALADNAVAYLKGDWTNQDPRITAYLRSFSRDGLPFYALYPAGGGAPAILPPILTEAMLVEEIRRAAH